MPGEHISNAFALKVFTLST